MVDIKRSTVSLSKTTYDGTGATVSATDYYHLGNDMYFVLHADVPRYSTTSDRTFVLTDTMPSGLTLDNIDNLSLDSGMSLDEGADYTLTPSSGGYSNGFRFELTPSGLEKAAGAKLNFTLKTTLTSVNDASGYPVTVRTNTATLTYSKDSVTTATHVIQAQASSYLFTLRINAYAEGAASGAAQLQGAEFTLYKDYTDASNSGTAVGTYTYDSTTGTYVCSSLESDGSIPLMEDGGDGHSATYTLVETKVPAGYLPITPTQVNLAYDGSFAKSMAAAGSAVADGQTQVALDADDTTVTTLALNVYDATSNGAGMLPSTGGTGTVALTVAGVLIMACGAAALLRRRDEASRGRGEK